MKILPCAGLLMGAMLVSQPAEAKCTPATERLLPRPASSGHFVTVLVTCDTRMDALKTFADLSTKQPNLLSSTAVNVEEVNLGAKGIYYRALLGEPGTKASAAATCTALKAAGYKWCRAMKH